MQKKYLLGVLALIAVLVLPTAIFAADIRSGETVAIKAEEKVADDLYLAGGNIASSGQVTGDLTAAGGNVFVSGSVSSDVMAAGGTVTIGGSVGDDIRVAGGNVTVAGPVAGDALAAGGTVHVISTAEIKKDARLAGGQVTVDAPVGGSLTVDGGTVAINGMVAGNTKINADKITIGSTAVLKGKLEYSSKFPIVIEKGAQVLGETSQLPVQRNMQKGGSAAGLLAVLTAAYLVKLLLFTVTVVALVLFMPKKSQDITETTKANFWPMALRGFIVLVVAPVAICLLMATFIGLPLAMIFGLVYLLMIIFAYLFAAIYIGAVVAQKMKKAKKVSVTWANAILGSVLMLVVGIIPVVGWVVVMIVMCASLGTLSGSWHKKLIQYK